jgi:hypothetical protein
VPETRPSLVGAFVSGAAGALAGVVGAFLQGWTPASLPVGLVLALLALAGALAVGIMLALGLGAGGAAAGWLVAVVVLLWPRPEGDVVLASTFDAYAFLFVGVLLCALGQVAAQRRSRTRGRAPMQPR